MTGQGLCVTTRTDVLKNNWSHIRISWKGFCCGKIKAEILLGTFYYFWFGLGFWRGVIFYCDESFSDSHKCFYLVVIHARKH